jgi:ATP synthase subunit 6
MEYLYYLYQPLSQFEATLYSNTTLSFYKENYYLSYIFISFFENFYHYYDLDFVFTWNYFNYKALLKQDYALIYLGYIYYYFLQIIIFKLIYLISLIFCGSDFLNRVELVPFLFSFASDTSNLEDFISNDEILINQVSEQFWIDTSINKFHTTIIFIFIFFLSFFVFSFKNLKFYKISWNFVLFSIVDEFLSSTIMQQLGIKRGQKYSVFLKSFFFLILFSNIFGLIPFSFTITSHLIFTFSLSLSLLIGITLLGFYFQGISFLKLLVPGGAPVFLLPLLVPIEFISYVARCFSLAIRLFANMMSGHTLLNILSGFVLKIAKNGFIFLAIAPLLVVMAVSVLELGIAFLQAYVFLVLVCIYLKDAFEAGH